MPKEKTIDDLLLELLASENAEVTAQEIAATINESLASKDAKIAELENKLSASEKDTEIQVEARKADLETIASLEAEVERLKGAAPKAKETFELGGKHYEVQGAVNIPGHGVRTALEIASTAELQDILVSRQSGMIREIK